ncbi:MAG: OmpA family protein [Pseudomonadota bacterium]|nr:OmpA family protein [Pseudomonadota bacterium]
MSQKILAKQLGIALITVAAGSASLSAQAGTGYVVSSSGEYWRGSNGECVRGGNFTTEGYTAGCDPEPVVVVEEEIIVVPPPSDVMETAILEADTLFGFDSDELGEDADEALSEVVGDIDNMTEVNSISIDGYTDSTGPEAYNVGLSERRAESVKDYLVSKGVPADAIETTGHGPANPIADNGTREGRAQNRRAVVTVEGEKVVVQ